MLDLLMNGRKKLLHALDTLFGYTVESFNFLIKLIFTDIPIFVIEGTVILLELVITLLFSQLGLLCLFIYWINR